MAALVLPHRVRSGDGNSVKMYGKQGSVLQIETTVIQPRDFKVYRGTEADPQAKAWRPLRKGVVDLRRRAEVSQACNQRYAQALAAAWCLRPLSQLVEPICRRTRQQERPVRALNPLGRQDAALLETVNRGEFAVNGFRNRDVRSHVYVRPSDGPSEQKRRSASVTRKLRLLRAHRLIRKVPKTHRYVLTDTGREAITTLLAARAADVQTLTKVA